MGRGAGRAFFYLVLAQAFHSIEEYYFRLWDFLPPARVVSRALSVDPAYGFAFANSALVLFGLWCFLLPVRRSWPAARIVMWCWCVVEAMNGAIHLALATVAGGYVPGLYTAPLLLASSAWLFRLLRREPAPPPGAGSVTAHN